jgi:peptide/nickel transport system substrate-binding protein
MTAGTKALFLATTLLGGCRRPAEPVSSAAVPETRTLRVLLSAEPATLDPQMPFDDVSSVVLSNVYESLVRFDRSLRLTAGLALRWINPDDRTWRFYLDPGARFADGTPVRATDVKYSLERIRSLAGSELSGFARHVVRTHIVDELTIDLQTDTPISILNGLTFIRIVSEAQGRKEPTAQPEGSGPYRIASWEKGKSIVLERNVHHRPVPAIPRIEILLAGNDEAALEALSKQRPDLFVLLRWMLRDRVARMKAPEHRMVSVEGLGVFYVVFNVRPEVPGTPGRNPLADKRVRRALALATDTAEVVREGIEGSGHAATQLVVPQVFGFDPGIEPPAYDLAGAKRLLAEAGAPAPKIPILVQSARLQNLEQVLARQWARAGARTSLVSLPPAEFQEALDSGRFVATVQGFACTSADTSELLSFAIHTPDAHGGYGAGNYGGFSNVELDALTDENLKVFDPRRRLEMLQRALRLASDELPLLPLVVSDDFYVISSHLRWDPPVNGVVDALEMAFVPPPAQAAGR